MKSFVVICFLALGIQGAMSENDIGGDGCIIGAACKRLGYIETVWLPIARPVCKASEADFKGGNGPAGPNGEEGQQGEVGQAGPNGDNGTKGEKGSTDKGAQGQKGVKGLSGPIGGPGIGDSLVFKSIIKVLCPVKHENKCFFPIIGRKLDYDEEVEICESVGGQLANIYSQAHMDDVMRYIRENRMDGFLWQDFRLGMKYDQNAKKLTLRDGTDAPAGLKWHIDTPHINAGYTIVLLRVRSDQSSIDQYLHNNPPLSVHERYVLCEIE